MIDALVYLPDGFAAFFHDLHVSGLSKYIVEQAEVIGIDENGELIERIFPTIGNGVTRLYSSVPDWTTPVIALVRTTDEIADELSSAQMPSVEILCRVQVGEDPYFAIQCDEAALEKYNSVLTGATHDFYGVPVGVDGAGPGFRRLGDLM
jgi:hypothetical protein